MSIISRVQTHMLLMVKTYFSVNLPLVERRVAVTGIETRLRLFVCSPVFVSAPDRREEGTPGDGRTRTPASVRLTTRLHNVHVPFRGPWPRAPSISSYKTVPRLAIHTKIALTGSKSSALCFFWNPLFLG